MSSNNIPTDEDFKRAEAADADRNRGLSDVSSRILRRFGGNDVHQVFMFYSPRIDSFGAFVFYRTNKQVAEAEESGLSSQIRQAVIEELGRAGRGDRDTLKVEFEFDSHENVEANYEGDYYLRLR